MNESTPRRHGDVRGSGFPPLSPLFEGRFGRMFRRLPPCPVVPQESLEQLAESMREPEAASGWNGTPQNFDNVELPAGYTYFGQFIDHDVTFDPVSSLDKLNDPDALTDFRTPRFDLDSVYGSGPQDEPFQYHRDDARRLLITNEAGPDRDVPRNSEGVALIGDPRNDENTIVSQLQVLFLRLHNRFLDIVVGDPSVPEDRKFDEAQRLTRWTHQYIIVNDYLPRIVGQNVVAQLLTVAPDGVDFNLRFYRAQKRAYMPIEFSAAAFRFGHSMVRGIYNLNDVVRDRPIFAAGDAVQPTDDLRGHKPLPSQWEINWAEFFPVGGSTPQPSRLIDARLVTALFDLPGEGPSLALRNLLRGQAMRLPSGQDVARHLRVPNVFSGTDLNAPEPTPLWFYALKESELAESQGKHLGPVGGRIVAEVLLGVLRADTQSYLNQSPAWVPPLAAAGERHQMADVVTFVA